MAVRIVFKNIPATGDTFRRTVAANADRLGLPINQAVFHYSDKGPIHSTSPFRWGGNNKSVWLNAVTADAEVVALTELKTIAACLQPMTGHIPAIQLMEQSMEITMLPYVKDYRVLNMVVNVPKPHQAPDDAALYLLEHLPRKIAESFATQSDDLGLTIPDAMRSASAIDYVMIEKIVPIKVKADTNKYRLAVTFTAGIRASIGQGWAVGLLLSHGHGNIVRSAR